MAVVWLKDLQLMVANAEVPAFAASSWFDSPNGLSLSTDHHNVVQQRIMFTILFQFKLARRSVSFNVKRVQFGGVLAALQRTFVDNATGSGRYAIRTGFLTA